MQRGREKEVNKIQRKEAWEWAGKWTRGMNEQVRVAVTFQTSIQYLFGSYICRNTAYRD